MLGSTYAIPWPPFYESMLSTMAAVNIDVGQWLVVPSLGASIPAVPKRDRFI